MYVAEDILNASDGNATSAIFTNCVWVGLIEKLLTNVVPFFHSSESDTAYCTCVEVLTELGEGVEHINRRDIKNLGMSFLFWICE